MSRRSACPVAIAIITAAALLPALAAASPAGVGEQLSGRLSGLDAAKIPTGILYDRVLPMSGIAALDGGPGAPPVGPAQWRQALDEIRRASLSQPGWPRPEQLRAEGRKAGNGGVVPLAVLDCLFGRLREDAVAKGLVSFESDRAIARPEAASGDLYRVARVLAATALVDRTCHGAQVEFRLERRLYLGNDPAAPRRLEFDPADGGGFRDIAFDVPVRVAYGSAGRRTPRLRVTLADGTVLQSAFPFVVEALATPLPTETWPLTAAIPYLGAVATGEAYVYLAAGHTAVTNPVIVVEGFDIDNSMNWDELYALLNREDLLESLRADGYDAVVLNFTDSTDYIQRNAYLLVQLIQQVNAVAAGGRAPVVVGASMGGLVGRFALAYMEAEAIPHGVRNFISFDGAQQGADIPLGLQYWLDFFQDDSADAAYLLSRLDRPAALQMLLYHHSTPPGSTGQSDPLRAALTSELLALGDYPQQTRKVAIANGSGTRANQGFAAGAQIIRYEYASLLVDITGNVWAVPDQASTKIFDGVIDLIWPLPDTRQSVTVSGTRPWDSAPGGWRASMAQMDTAAVSYGDIVALYPAHCFIPTVSALALATDDPFFDIPGTPDLLAMTPFDAVYCPAANQEHVLVTAENKAWIIAEIERAPTAVPGEPLVPGAAPREPVLAGSYPNPFNPRTTIRYTLPEAGEVSLAVYDQRGRLVRELIRDRMPAGPHDVAWDGLDARGRPAPSGTYLLRLGTESAIRAGKVLLAR